MKLSDYESLIQNALIEQKDVADSLQCQSDRLELYSSFVHSHYENSLIKMFPRLNQLTDLDWPSISKLYVEQFPVKAWELNEITINFPQFISQNTELFPNFAYDLARYELAEFFVHMNPANNSNVQVDRLKLNPVHEFLHLEFNIFEWVKELEAIQKEKEILPSKEETFGLITRRSNFQLSFTKLNAYSLAIYSELIEDCLSKDEIAQRIQGLFPGVSFKENDLEREIDFLIKQEVILVNNPALT